MQRLLYFVNVDWYFQLHWLERARAAMAAGYDVHVMGGFTKPEIRRQFEGMGLTCHGVRLDRAAMNPFSALQTLRDARRVIKSVRPDVLHCITVKPNLFGGIVAKRLGIPTVFSVTGLGLAFSSRTWKARLSRRIIVALYRSVLGRKRYVVVFENGDDKVKFEELRLGDKDALRVIAGAGVDTNRFAYSEEPDGATVKVLLASRMLWDKGIKDVIEAARLLHDKDLDFDLNVAGIIDRQSQNAVPEEQILRWHENKLINWLGTVDDMEPVIKDSNILILPTCYGEGVPRILIEGAAVGRSAVVTDVSGCRDIVRDGETGFLVPVRNPAALAERLEELIRDRDLRAAMGKKARSLVESKFDQKWVIEETLQQYDAVSRQA